MSDCQQASSPSPPLLSNSERGKKKDKMTGLVKLWYWNVEARPQRLRELKGPEG